MRPFQSCFHRCRGECIVERPGGGCSPSCHAASAYVPPDPDSPVGRYLALLKRAEDKAREALGER